MPTLFELRQIPYMEAIVVAKWREVKRLQVSAPLPEYWEAARNLKRYSDALVEMYPDNLTTKAK